MTLLSLFEEEKQKLLSEISRAQSAEQAAGCADKVLDRVLYRYSESCESERLRGAASYFVGLVKLSLPLMDCMGETRVWESSQGEEEETGKAGKAGGAGSVLGRLFSGKCLVFLVLAAVLAVASVVLTARTGDGSFRFTGAPASFGCLAAGVLLAVLSGLLAASGSRKKKGKTETFTEIRPDADKIYCRLRAVLLSADQNLKEIEVAEQRDQRERAKLLSGDSGDRLDGNGVSAIPAETLELFGGLLEASYAKDGQYALDRLEDVKYYLHRKGVETQDFTEEHRDWFDTLPSDSAGTFRPALTAGGKLLKKGLAGKV